MPNQDKPKRGRQFGAYPQQLLRVACELQELRGIHEAVPDTRQRTIALLAVPELIETQELVAKQARAIVFAASTLQVYQDTLVAQALGRIANMARDIAELAESAAQALKGE